MIDFKKIAVYLIVFFSVTSLYSDTVWEGSAAMSRFGEFPVNGLYGASNAFPVNTVVNVENPYSKKSTDIIIVNELKDSNIFLLLSKDAAEKIDIKQDEVTGVRVKMSSIVRSSDVKPSVTEKTLAPDPDYNPSAINKDTAAFSEPPQVLKDEEIIEETAEEIVEKTSPADVPEVDIPVPPVVYYNDEIIPEEAAAGIDDSEIDDFRMWEEEIKRFEQFGGEESLIYDDKYVLVPTAPKPPGKIPEPAIPEDKTTVKTTDKPAAESSYGDYTVSLEKNNYYLQLGAFRDIYAAKELKEKIDLDYPLLIYYEKSTNYYKLMAGPLKNDEKGLALLKVRYIGFKDAFIKKSE